MKVSMNQIKLIYLMKLLTNTLFIALIPIIIIISFLYSSNFNLLSHNYTLVKGNSFYFDDDILKNIQFNESLLSIEPIEIQNQLNNLEYIESSKVSKIYPNTILIEVIENKPLLYFKQNNDLIIIDDKNNFLTVNNKVKQFFKIPIVIISDESNNSTKLNKLDVNLYAEIIDMVKYSKNYFNSLYSDLNKIYISDNDYVLLYKNNTKIYLSKNNATNQIKYLSIFKDTIKNHRTLKNYLYIDFRTENQIIVKEKNII